VIEYSDHDYLFFIGVILPQEIPDGVREKSATILGWYGAEEKEAVSIGVFIRGFPFLDLLCTLDLRLNRGILTMYLNRK
jgi:hypothetical protein